MQALWPKLLHELAKAELVEAARRVWEHVAVTGEAAEQVDVMQQRDVLDDQGVRRSDWLTGADRYVGDATEAHHGCSRALRAEARERLRVAALNECGDRQQLSRRHDPLAAAAVDADLEHACTMARRRRPVIRA